MNPIRHEVSLLNESDYLFVIGGRWSCCVCGNYYGDPNTKKISMLDSDKEACRKTCKSSGLNMYGWDDRGLPC